jgi:hypothetical protein
VGRTLRIVSLVHAFCSAAIFPEIFSYPGNTFAPRPGDKLDLIHIVWAGWDKLDMIPTLADPPYPKITNQV